MNYIARESYCHILEVLSMNYVYADISKCLHIFRQVGLGKNSQKTSEPRKHEIKYKKTVKDN
jgi:hypothetical protein